VVRESGGGAGRGEGTQKRKEKSGGEGKATELTRERIERLGSGALAAGALTARARRKVAIRKGR